MGGLSKVSKKCSSCLIQEECFKKKMEACAYLTPASETISDDADMPVLRETVDINVGGTLTTVYKDEIEKEIYKNLIQPVLQFGA